MRARLAVYLKWDQYEAVADYLLSRYGLEVPYGFEIPSWKVLPPVKLSVCDWPERVVING